MNILPDDQRSRKVITSSFSVFNETKKGSEPLDIFLIPHRKRYLIPVFKQSNRQLSFEEAVELQLEIASYIDYMFCGGREAENSKDYLPSPDQILAKVPESPTPGFVYLINACGTQRYKIGISRNVEKRMKVLGVQSPYPLKLIHSFESAHAAQTEAQLHVDFHQNRVHGEWFDLTSAQVELIKSYGKRKSGGAS